MTIYYDALQNGSLKALSFLIAGLFIYVSYYFGQKNIGFKRNFWGYTGKILIAIIVVGFISWIFSSNLGSHTEECDDPLYGQCERVQDYQPTSKQYQEEFAKLFVLLFVPYVFGLFKGPKDE